ncbi:hypothetical protein AB0N79_35565 [Streptomyces microflavus]
MTTNTPPCGWDRAAFRRGAENTATAATNYLKTVGHSDAQPAAG